MPPQMSQRSNATPRTRSGAQDEKFTTWNTFVPGSKLSSRGQTGAPSTHHCAASPVGCAWTDRIAPARYRANGMSYDAKRDGSRRARFVADGAPFGIFMRTTVNPSRAATATSLGISMYVESFVTVS